MSVNPFLISRNKTLDYRVIVSPSVIENFHLNSILLDAVFRVPNLDELENQFLYRQIDNKVASGFTIIFRVKIATLKEIGQNSESLLRDQQGREIRFCEGLLFEERLPRKEIKMTHDIFSRIDSLLIDYYQDFWKENTSRVGISLPFDIFSDAKDLLEFIELPSFTVRS